MSESVFATTVAEETPAQKPEESTTETPVQEKMQETPVSQEFSYDTFVQMLPEHLRTEKVFQNISKEKPIEDMALQFYHAQKLVGVDKIEAPKEDWPKEKWDSFYERIGRPKTPDDYKVPDFGDLPVDDKVLSDFKKLAHDTGMTSKQVESVLSLYGNMVKEQTGKYTQEAETQLKEKMLAFRTELGDNFNTVLKEAEFGFTRFADEDMKALISSRPDLQNEPAVIRHFQKLAKMAREDAARSGDQTNPLNIATKEQALDVLKRFEEEHSRLLFKSVEGLTLHEKTQRDQLLRRREELYKLAYAE